MKTGCFLTAALLACTSVVAQTQKVSLAGEWSYRLDPADEGVAAAWYASPLDGSLQLPGSLTTNGIGNEVDAATPWVGSMHNRMWYNDPAYARYRATGSTKVVFWLSPEKLPGCGLVSEESEHPPKVEKPAGDRAAGALPLGHLALGGRPAGGLVQFAVGAPPL